MPASVTDHSLTEVYNQCASIERLLDALQWAQGEAYGLNDYHVVQCHPTTSSAAGDPYDNELVLVGPAGGLARFEVSDVGGAGARLREEKDLRCLGVLQSGRGAVKWNVDWPEGRLFLVASEELTEYLRRPTRGWLKGPTPYCHYVEVKDDGSTRIFEVKRGPAS